MSPILAAEKVSKRYGGIQALDQVDVALPPGRVIALAGQNGAGKSTLVKIISGATQPDGGRVIVDGRPLRLDSVLEAQRAGIRVVHQTPALALELNVVDNIFLGSELYSRGAGARWPVLDRRAMLDRIRPLLESFAPNLDPRSRLIDLKAHERRMVGILKALANSARVLILDEPTAALPADERVLLLDTVRRLRDQGLALLYVTHHMEEIEQLADEVVVLRDGCLVGHEVGAVKAERVIALMLGKSLTLGHSVKAAPESVGPPFITLDIKPPSPDGQVLEITRPVQLQLRKGEIAVLTGLIGSGIADVAAAAFGDRPRWTIQLTADGRRRPLSSPHEAMTAGIGYLSDDRIAESVFPDLTVRANMSMAALARITRRSGRIDQRRERSAVWELVQSLQIRLGNQDQLVTELSGGNQQKVMIGRWLLARSRLLILNEPTQGIDVLAKAEVQAILSRFAEEGGAVLIVTTDPGEFLTYASRVLVMRQGEMVAELSGAAISGTAVRDAIIGHAPPGEDTP